MTPAPRGVPGYRRYPTPPSPSRTTHRKHTYFTLSEAFGLRAPFRRSARTEGVGYRRYPWYPTRITKLGWLWTAQSSGTHQAFTAGGIPHDRTAASLADQRHASAEVRGWVEDRARTTVPDRVRFPVTPADISDAELIATYPRPEAPRHGTEGDPENWNIPWVRKLEDWRWAQMARYYIAINGGWPLPPPITWHPEQLAAPGKIAEFLRARDAHNRGEGPLPVPSPVALRRLQLALDADWP